MSSQLSSDSEAQLAKVARGGAINLVGAVVSSVGGFLLVVIVTNGVDPTAAGTLFSAVSIFMILTAVSSLGTDTGMARFMLRLEARDRHRDIGAVLKWAATPVATTSCVIALAVLFGANSIAPRLGLESGNGASILRVIAVMVPIAAISDFALALTRAFGRMRPTALIDSMLRVSLQVVLMLIIGRHSGTGGILAAAWFGPYVVTSALATVVARRVIATRRKGWPKTDLAPTEMSAVGREFWIYTWPRGIARVCQIIIQRLDIVLIAVLIGASSAAIYTAATRFVVLGQFAVMAIQQVLQPRFSQLIARDELETVRDVFKISTAWSMTLAWPMYLTAACAAPLYLSMFGKGYENGGVPVVVIMALSMMFSIAAGPLDTLLLMAGGSGASLANTIAALVVSVGGGLILIPRIGIVGAAIAWGLAVVTRNTLAFVQVYGMLKLTPWSGAAARVAIASICCFAVPLIVLQAFGYMRLVPFLAVLVAGCAAYALALWQSSDVLALNAMTALLKRRITE